MSAPASITICGTLDKAAIADLVEIAIAAGAALMVQPRVIAGPSPDVEASSRKALPPARRSVTKRTVPATESSIDDRLRRVLKDGPVALRELRRVTPLKRVRQLVVEGAIVATGSTKARRYALPGTSAKEAP